jgi:hypothetical protein
VHRIDDPIWPGSLVWLIDSPDCARCSDCGITSRVVDFLPMFRVHGYDPRKECPACYAPGYVIDTVFQVVDAGGNLWNGATR